MNVVRDQRTSSQIVSPAGTKQIFPPVLEPQIWEKQCEICPGRGTEARLHNLHVCWGALWEFSRLVSWSSSHRGPGEGLSRGQPVRLLSVVRFLDDPRERRAFLQVLSLRVPRGFYFTQSPRCSSRLWRLRLIHKTIAEFLRRERIKTVFWHFCVTCQPSIHPPVFFDLSEIRCWWQQH